MKLFYPEYYRAFTCIAAACEDSCCKEWEVDVDAQSAAYYRQLPGELGQRLREVLRQEDGCTLMTIEDGRCPMWRQDGLCRIQAQYGHDALCQTCRQYPRLRHEYGSFTELDLELSCPEAARLIFSGSQKIITESVSGATAPEYDQAAMETLLRSRQEILTFLNSDTQPLPRQMAVLLLYAHSVQAELDGGNEAVFDPASALEFLDNFTPEGQIAPIIDFYLGLEILTDRWKQRLMHHSTCLNWGNRLVRFLTYGIRRYWLQAVSDYDLICRVKFLISACILLCALGGDTVATAQLWSKEIENNPDNVDALLDAAYCSPAFTDKNLLSILKNAMI